MKEEQHCGKLPDHPPHEHKARVRMPALRCHCDKTPCECVEFTRNAGAMRKRTFWCTGVLITEGAPPFNPVVVPPH
jgi:hypothetical protein